MNLYHPRPLSDCFVNVLKVISIPKYIEVQTEKQMSPSELW